MGIIILAVLGFMLFFGIKYFNNRDGEIFNSNHKENPLDVLKWRYAKGEISKETYDSMKNQL